MTRQRYDANTLTARAGTGVDRTANLEAMLREEQTALRALPADAWEHHTAAANVATLEKAIESSKRNDAARDKIEANIAAAKEAESAKQEARRAALADEEKAAIKQQYIMANRAATEAEFEAAFEAAFPRLLERHRERQMDAAAARARAAMRSTL